MSNEELARRIQAGERESMVELWRQVQRLAVKLMLRYAPDYARRGNVVDLDDMTQAAYIAVHEAVQDYREDKPFRFVSYLSYHVRNEAAALLGFRTAKRRVEAVSLDAPLGEDSDTELADLIPDETAEAALDDVIEREYRRELRAVLDDCLKELPPEQGGTIRARFFARLPLDEIGRRHGEDAAWARKQEDRALRSLRKPRTLQRLRQFKSGISANEYHTSFQSFTRQRASVTELAVERLASCR